MMFECMFDRISQHLPTDKRQAAHDPANSAKAAWLRVEIVVMAVIRGQGTTMDAISMKSSGRYSHSMVPGGLLVTSSTTRLTSATSLVIRVEIRSSTS
jgi:hypothetical protein